MLNENEIIDQLRPVLEGLLKPVPFINLKGESMRKIKNDFSGEYTSPEC